MTSSSSPNLMQTEPTQKAELGMAMVRPSKRPEWLPEGWKMEVRTRDSGKIDGMKDRFYFDSSNSHNFRLKKEFEYFLQTETIRRNTPKSKTTDSAINRSSTVRFDFENRPAKVSWALSNSSKGSWTPYIDNEEVPESTKRAWVAAMKDIYSDTLNSPWLNRSESMHFRVMAITFKSKSLNYPPMGICILLRCHYFRI